MLKNLKLHWQRFRNPESVLFAGVRIGTKEGTLNKSVRSAIFKGTYESYECDLVEKYLKKGDKVLEVGTGIGLVSLVSTKICGEGQVFSYEANRGLEERIRANYRLNSWTPNLVMKAVTSDGRTLTFFRNENVVSSSLHDRGLGAVEETIESVQFSDVLAEIQPTALVMDVEGAEEELFEWCGFESIRIIIVEMHPHIIGEERVAELNESLIAQGFKMQESQHKTYCFVR